MAFPTGNVSFHRFRIVGDASNAAGEVLEKIKPHLFAPHDLGMPEEVEYGWGGARHLYDAEITHESCVFAECVHFGLRIETNKVPGAVFASHVAQEEAAVAKMNPSGFLSKLQRKAARESVKQKLEQEVRDGKHKRTRIVPVLWDVEAGTVYANATGSTLEKLMEIFERSFALALQPLTAGEVAAKLTDGIGRRAELDDLRPARFVLSGDGDDVHPDYPWTRNSFNPTDFLGNEFLVWLWFHADGRTSVIEAAGGRNITVMFGKGIDLDCAYGQTGRDAIRTVGPTRTPEARDALRIGKVPRKAGLILDANSSMFSLTLQAETLGVGGARLPGVEDADTPRKEFEERIGYLRDLGSTIDTLFGAFLAIRMSGEWDFELHRIRRWIEMPPANADALTRDQLEATKRLAPSPDGDIEKVTLSSGGRSVTLTPETRKRIGKVLAETK